MGGQKILRRKGPPVRNIGTTQRCVVVGVLLEKAFLLPVK